MNITFRHQRTTALFASSAAMLLLGACAVGDAASDTATTGVAATEAEDHDHDVSAATQQEAPTPRLVLTYDGGIVVIEADTLDTVADLSIEGFNRLNNAGDGRHVAVSTAGGWAVVDAGTWSEAHGDHSHYFTAEPELYGVVIEAETPGHVVVHDGLVSLFDDATGHVTVVEASEWADMAEHGHAHIVSEYDSEAAHHGVAVALADGGLVVTRGTSDGRTGAMLLDADGAEVAVSDACPGVHGETAFHTGRGDVVVTGCEDGALVFADGQVHKIAAPDAFGRIGNAFSVNDSSVVLGDYKTDPEGGIGLGQITLIDVDTESILVVDPFLEADAEYTWRGLARGVDGEALVLGTDGVLRVLDPVTGEQLRAIDVVEPWEVPAEWQTAHPALTVLEGMAYVTEPATGTIHIVDYVGGEVWKSAAIGVTMNEVVGVTG